MSLTHRTQGFGRSIVSPIVLMTAIAIIYLSFLTKVYYWDGIAFAQTIEDAATLNSTLLHPSHLIYNSVGFIIYRLIRFVGVEVRALTVLQVLNTLLSAAAAAIMFSILRTTVRSVDLSLTLAALFAFSATWWRFSTDANAYIPSVLLMLIGFYFILPGKPPRPFIVATIFVATLLFHQLAIFFGGVLVLGLILQAKGTKARAIAVLKLGLLTTFVAGMAYFALFHFVTGKLGLVDFFRWITYHSPDGEFSFDAVSNLRYSLQGHVRLFFGGRVNWLKGLVTPAIVCFLISLAITAAISLYLLFKWLRHNQASWPRLRDWRSERRSLFLLAGVWTLSYLVFLFFWIPQNTFYRLFYFPALIILIGVFVAPEKPKTERRLTSFWQWPVAVVALSNFLFLIFPTAHVEKYPPLEFAYQLKSEWPAQTTVLYAAENSDLNLIRYFNPDAVWKPLRSRSLDELDDFLKQNVRDSAEVWLETTAIDTLNASPEGAQWLRANSGQNVLREVKDSAYRIRFLRISPPLSQVDCNSASIVVHN